jgi:hypothetical protein
MDGFHLAQAELERLGRAGRKGICVTLYGPRDRAAIEQIERFTKNNFEWLQPPNLKTLVLTAAETAGADAAAIPDGAAGLFRPAAAKHEFGEYGSANDKANNEYILHGTACQEPLLNHIRTQITTGKYHGGSLGPGDFYAGHDGWTFNDFVEHPHCIKAELERPHVLALCAYTSSSYPCFNAPLRMGTQPHPFKMTVYYLDQAIRKLRAVAATDDPDFNKEVSRRAAASPPRRGCGTRAAGCTSREYALRMPCKLPPSYTTFSLSHSDVHMLVCGEACAT